MTLPDIFLVLRRDRKRRAEEWLFNAHILRTSIASVLGVDKQGLYTKIVNALDRDAYGAEKVTKPRKSKGMFRSKLKAITGVLSKMGAKEEKNSG